MPPCLPHIFTSGAEYNRTFRVPLEKPTIIYTPVSNPKNTYPMLERMTTLSKQFPFTKRAIEAISPHDSDSKSREAEYFNLNALV